MAQVDAVLPATPQEDIAEKENVTENPHVSDTNKENEGNKDSKENGEEADKNDEFKWENVKSLYEFTVKDIDGNEVSLSKYQGYPTLIVNVASNCGFTKNNYNQLNQLFDKYEAQGLRIAAFPCSQFMNQEPGCDVDIKEFIKKNNVKFDVYSKIPAVNGAEAVPLYRWLKIKQKGIFGTTSIKWNFTKFLVNKEGEPIKRYSPTTSPNSIEPDIKSLLE